MTAEDASRKRVVVIGGGISGLAAAHRLVELDGNCEVTLLEAGDCLGGVLQTTRDDGYLIEHSADNFITDPPWAVQLCERIGFADELIPTSSQERGALVVHRGRLERVPPGFMLMAPARLWPLVTTPLLSAWGKLRLLSEPLVPRRQDGADESLGSFARRRLGREVFERIVQPLVGGIYTADPEKLSLRATLPRFLEMEQQHGSLVLAARRQRGQAPGDDANAAGGARYGMFVAPRNGMSSLVAAIAARLPTGTVRLQRRVQSVSRGAAGGWQARATTADGQSEVLDCAGLIMATPAAAAARLLQPIDAALAGELARIEYAGTAIVTQAYRRAQIAHALDGFGFVVPAREGRRILAGSFASVKFPGRAPADCMLVRVFVGGACQSELLRLSDEELRQLATDELRVLLGAQGEPLRSSVARWPQAMPQYHVGHCELVARIEQAADAWPGLALAGNAYHGVGIPNCVRSGELAAERLIRSAAACAVG
ncbi:MAG: protoporphyrinogen oxidase [Pirellulales bacterium]